MIYALQIVSQSLKSFFDFFVSLEVYTNGSIHIYLYQLIIVGAVVLPFLFSLISLNE